MANEFATYYTVHSAVVVPHPTTVEIEGEKHEAIVKAIVVELVPEDPNSPHGSVKLVRVAGADTLKALLEVVKPGARVQATFSIMPAVVKES